VATFCVAMAMSSSPWRTRQWRRSELEDELEFGLEAAKIENPLPRGSPCPPRRTAQAIRVNLSPNHLPESADGPPGAVSRRPVECLCFIEVDDHIWL
jgi:hypothetical protein